MGGMNERPCRGVGGGVRRCRSFDVDLASRLRLLHLHQRHHHEERIPGDSSQLRGGRARPNERVGVRPGGAGGASRPRPTTPRGFERKACVIFYLKKKVKRVIFFLVQVENLIWGVQNICLLKFATRAAAALRPVLLHHHRLLRRTKGRHVHRHGRGAVRGLETRFVRLTHPRLVTGALYRLVYTKKKKKTSILVYNKYFTFGK